MNSHAGATERISTRLRKVGREGNLGSPFAPLLSMLLVLRWNRIVGRRDGVFTSNLAVASLDGKLSTPRALQHLPCRFDRLRLSLVDGTGPRSPSDLILPGAVRTRRNEAVITAIFMIRYSSLPSRTATSGISSTGRFRRITSKRDSKTAIPMEGYIRT